MMKKYAKIVCVIMCISIIIIEQVFAAKSYNPLGMYWRAYGDGTFAYIPEEAPPDYTIKRGSWYQYADGSWGFFVSIDGGFIFEPLKSRSAFINFVDNPIYNLYSFDENGKMIGGEFRNLTFPPEDSYYIDVYAYRVNLKMQPGGICVNEGSALKSRSSGPLPYR